MTPSVPDRSAPDRTTTLHDAMRRRMYQKAEASGEITVPAVPAMIDEYVTLCDNLFSAVGRKFSDDDLARLREVLERQLAEAYRASPRSSIVISYDARMQKPLNYHIKGVWWSVAGAYENWLNERTPPLFGSEPDARVRHLAAEFAVPTACPVLDIGAGTGRNALPLARLGHPVDAVEMTPKFADAIRAEAGREALDVRVVQRDVFESADALRSDYRLIVLAEVVSDFRSAQQLRELFELSARSLAPGGLLVFNTFLARDGYEPDAAARQLGQQVHTGISTHKELSEALGALPLDLIADDSVYDYEKAHLPDGAWPQTGWFESWVSGQDLFDVARTDSPIDNRWLVYRRR